MLPARVRRHVGSLAALVLALVAACSGSSPSTGTSNWNALPRCAAVSGPLSSPSGALCYLKSAAPSGACSGEADCGFCGYVPCPGGGGAGFAYSKCTCADGTWSCAVMSQDASACLPGDASTVCPTAHDPVPGLTDVYLPSDLPSGACDGATSCFIVTATPCADSTALPPEKAWQCTCVNQSWGCTLSWSSHSICPPADGGG